jgi:putative transposase
MTTALILRKKTMLNSPCRIWIHAMFSTRDELPLITPAIEKKIYNFMKEQFELCGCECRIINGASNHVHTLFQMNYKMPITDILKMVKGATSHWINANELTVEKFSWQKGFNAFSVGVNNVESIEIMIANQKSLHAYETYQEEHIRYLLQHGINPQLGYRRSDRGKL